MKFPEYSSDYSFPDFEEKILEYWNSNKIFEKSLDEQKYKKDFHFYDGPPFATGLPHYGHLLAGTIKDIVPRYWTMQGYRVKRRFGWDCHGLPVEFEMEKSLKLNGSIAIKEYGVAKFNEACRGIVLRYTSEWQQTVERMGRWVDMDNDYKTMQPEFMESVWWIFKKLWDKGLIYQGKKVVPYSWRLTAPLSNFEASQNYKSVQDPAVTVLFPLLDDPKTALSIWTTTPWTLPSNLAIAVQPNKKNMQYARYKLKEKIGQIENVIMATDCAEKYNLDDAIEEIDNKKLVGLKYKALFSLFEKKASDSSFEVIAGDFVTGGEGTGLVHCAPSFGEDDFFVCQASGIEALDPTNEEACFTEELRQDPELKDFSGFFVHDANKGIIQKIKDKNRLLKQETLQHNVPFCERSDTPLIYKAISSWFVKVEDVKAKMIENNQSISWVPSHIKDGRFGKWLENARDWCISRNRFWGTPIPVWICDKCEDEKVIGSIEELEKFSASKHTDLHKHFVDEVKAKCEKCAEGTYIRVEQVLDCWFESGSMPYAQSHYPFENKEEFEKSFPANFIAEGLDQTRGWFYTLTVLSTILFEKPAFQNCIVNGMVLAEDGKKMSKRLRNYPDPNELIKSHGADAIRLYLMQSPAMYGQDLRFSERAMIELKRAVMLPLWNAYSFFASYANIDQWSSDSREHKSDLLKEGSLLDKWILLRAKQCAQDIHSSMQNYQISEMAPSLLKFIDDLTNWYIRLNRDRFWCEKNSQSLKDKELAYGSLYCVLKEFSKLLAPALPFFAEMLWQSLNGFSVKDLAKAPENSIHLELFESLQESGLSKAEEETLESFKKAQSVILLGRALRAEIKIPLRQPLQKMRLVGVDSNDLGKNEDIVLSELNIKEIEYIEKESQIVSLAVKPNFKILGKKLGKDMKSVKAALDKWSEDEIKLFEKNSEVEILGYKLDSSEIEIVRKAKEGSAALAQFSLVAEFDTNISTELRLEGLQREIVNRIQQRRKEMDFHLADRIRVYWSASEDSEIYKVLTSEDPEKESYISKETLSVSWKRKNDLTKLTNLKDFGDFCFELEQVK